MEHIKFDEIIKATLNLLKNCPDDFQNLRVEIVNRLKFLVNCCNSQNKLKDIDELINDEIILGKNKF